MKTYSEPAIILKTAQIKDNDLLVTLLGKNLGLVSAVAKSARQSKRRFMGGLDLFDCGLLQLRETKHGSIRYQLEDISKRESWPNLSKNLSLYQLATYCLEITLMFSAEGDKECAELFQPLFQTLKAINKQTEQASAMAIATFYNLQLLEICGFNYLEHPDSDLNLTETLWLEQMFHIKQVVLPHDSNVLTRGFNKLLAFTQTQANQAVCSLQRMNLA